MKKLLLAAVALVLAGCSTSATSPSEPPEMPEPAPVTQQTLQELREEFGLPDCPATDADVAAVDGGLPQTALPCLGTDES
ncbi:MAG: hypothetical protein GX596_03405, partial [Propionibacterium sp.]|nr:hypothetical protein [Propionibacterium sp.]